MTAHQAMTWAVCIIAIGGAWRESKRIIRANQLMDAPWHFVGGRTIAAAWLIAALLVASRLV